MNILPDKLCLLLVVPKTSVNQTLGTAYNLFDEACDLIQVSCRPFLDYTTALLSALTRCS